jgi:4-amino-4-deoxy-L-arabinose transferase-like glycosyltransferase
MAVPFLMGLDDRRRVGIYFLCLVVYAALLFLVGLGERPLSGHDEPRVAGIAAEMGRFGDIIVPRLNGKPFLEKPPLYFWTLSTAFNLFGQNSLTARTASALAAICGIALVFVLARNIGLSPFSAFITGLVLTTSCEYFSLARRCLIDMMLCLFTTSAMWCFFHASRSLPRRTPWYIGFTLSLSCAVMTKGLVGLAIPLSALCIWLLIKKGSCCRVWCLFLISSALCIIPMAVWIWFLHNDLGWNAVYETVWTNNFGRFTGSSREHIRPFYYYFNVFPLQFLPWTLFLPIAFTHHLREIRERKKENPLLLPLAWFAVSFLLLSISAEKRGLYLLPLYPAAALLVGAAVGSVLEKGEGLTRWFSLPSEIVALGFLLISLCLGGARIYLERSFSIWPLVSLAGFCLGLWAYQRFRRKDFAVFFKILAVALLAVYLTFDIGITPIFGRRESYEPLFQYCNSLNSEEARVSLFKPSETISGAAVFYMGKTLPVLNGAEDLENFLRTEKMGVAILEEKSVQRIEGFDVMKHFKVGSRTYLVVGNDNLDKEIQSGCSKKDT